MTIVRDSTGIFEVKEREREILLDFVSTRNILLFFFLQSFTAENNENVSHKYLHALNDTCTHTQFFGTILRSNFYPLLLKCRKINSQPIFK